MASDPVPALPQATYLIKSNYPSSPRVAAMVGGRRVLDSVLLLMRARCYRMLQQHFLWRMQ
jgi:hypothetical protein